MNDYDLQKMRELCTNFERDLMKLLHFYADTIACEEMEQAPPWEDEQTNTETSPETKPETSPEIDNETISRVKKSLKPTQ